MMLQLLIELYCDSCYIPFWRYSLAQSLKEDRQEEVVESGVMSILQTFIDNCHTEDLIVADPDIRIEETGLDSLSFMELITELEDTFDINLPDDSGVYVATANDLIALVTDCILKQKSA